jgi:hypothetical protein
VDVCIACWDTRSCAICEGQTVLLAEPPGGPQPCPSCAATGECRYCVPRAERVSAANR